MLCSLVFMWFLFALHWYLEYTFHPLWACLSCGELLCCGTTSLHVLPVKQWSLRVAVLGGWNPHVTCFIKMVVCGVCARVHGGWNPHVNLLASPCWLMSSKSDAWDVSKKICLMGKPVQCYPTSTSEHH
eukprot:2360382-Amphidinium_carterae.1